jgi:transposase, IS30 family
MKETERLVALRVEGLSLRGIAPELGRAAPTISRELRRNALAKGGYPRCTRKAATPNAGSAWPSSSATSTLGASSATGLLEGWRPEQIAGWLRRSEERGWGLLATETIHAFVHRPGQNGEKLWRLLPRGVRGGVAVELVSCAALSPSATRPVTVRVTCRYAARRGRCRSSRNARPGFMLAARLDGKSAAETVTVLIAVFRRLDSRLRT